MEEKERYELFGEFGIIHDTSPNAECMLLNKFQTCEILNKQDKENQQLKQQLHDLPKKIVCEISESIERLSWRKRIYTNWEFDKEQLYKDLDTILKKYGGEDEINND